MLRIERLTEAQEAQLSVFQDKWISIGLSTEPAVRKEAEKAIVLSYKYAALKPPKKIVWCGSPLSQGLTRAIILDKTIRDSVWDSVRDSVGASVRDSVGASVRDSVWDSVRDSVWDSVGASVWDSVWDSVGASVRASVWDSVWDSVGASVRDSVWDSVRDSVWDSVRDSVGASVRDSVWDSVGASVRASVWDSIYGQHDAHWIGFYDYFNFVVGLKEQTQKLEGLWLLAKNAGWALPHEKICWVSERHNVLHRDDRGRLHNLLGPAVMYPDGWTIYAVHGVRVPEWIIEEKQKIKVKDIESESNSEIRRIMINQYGQDKYLIDSGAEEINRDDYGILYRKEISGDENLVMVKVLNSSLELDGTRKEYFLRVPSDMKTAQEAVAWSFNMNKEEYSPLVES